MRRLGLLILGALGFAALPGCGGHEGTVKRYLADLANLDGAFKQTRKTDFPSKVMAPFGGETNLSAILTALQADVRALKELNSQLSDEEKLQLQLKYGPVVEGLALDIGNEINARLHQQQGAPPVVPPSGFNEPGLIIYTPSGLQNAATLVKSSDAPFLVEGYPAVAKDTVKDAGQLVQNLQLILSKTSPQAKAAEAANLLPAVRRFRYRLSVDAVRLHMVQSRVPEVADKQRQALRSNLTGLLNGLKRDEEQVQTLPGGQDIVNAIEPLPNEITALVAAGP